MLAQRDCERLLCTRLGRACLAEQTGERAPDVRGPLPHQVGNLLGEGRPLDARFCSAVAWTMAIGIQVVLTTAILAYRAPIASAFVDDPVVLEHVVLLLPFTTAYSFLATSVSVRQNRTREATSFFLAALWVACPRSPVLPRLTPPPQGFSQQLLFGLGEPLAIPAALNFVAFFLVGLPLGSLFAYQGGLDERGIWLGLVVAMAVALVGQYLFLFATVDWAAAAKRARERSLGAAGASATATRSESDGRGLAAADSASTAAATEKAAEVGGAASGKGVPGEWARAGAAPFDPAARL